MVNQVTEQFVVLSQAAQKPNQVSRRVALFNEDGTAKVVASPAAAQADFAGADLTALKVELNAFLAKLRAAGIVLP
jgi:hypothetical protein